MLKKFTNKKGFTLMEMLIVVAIIAVLVAIAIPTFNSALTRAKEGADVANIRAAYANCQIDMLTNGAKAPADKTEFVGKLSAHIFVVLLQEQKLNPAEVRPQQADSDSADRKSDRTEHEKGRGAFTRRPTASEKKIEESLLLMAHHAVVVHRIGLLLALHPVILRHSHRGAGNLGGADLGLIAVAHDAGIGRVGDLVGVDRMRNLGGDAAGGLCGSTDHHCSSGNGAGNRELAHGVLLFIGVYRHK